MEFYITKERYEELRNELEHLKKEGRIEIAERLKRAKEFGDLSENAEYAEAKEAQSKTEGRIIELENILRNSKIIKKSTGRKIVDLGASIAVEKGGEEFKYTIVGSNEANPEKNMISNESPLGKAFVGKKAGDSVDVETPKGKVHYRIVSIE